jgi:hypothetical protein
MVLNAINIRVKIKAFVPDVISDTALSADRAYIPSGTSNLLITSSKLRRVPLYTVYAGPRLVARCVLYNCFGRKSVQEQEITVSNLDAGNYFIVRSAIWCSEPSL